MAVRVPRKKIVKSSPTQIIVVNSQNISPLPIARMKRAAKRAVLLLKIREKGKLLVSFINSRRMRALNKEFMSHDWTTDVLSFRYDTEKSTEGSLSVIGEILIAPSEARRYARAHGGDYETELARYIIHGLLHWLGENDRSNKERIKMRKREDDILRGCGF